MIQKAMNPSEVGQDLAGEVDEAPWFQPHWADMVTPPVEQPTGLASPTVEREHPGAAAPGSV